jgi:hypothetical protein
VATDAATETGPHRAGWLPSLAESALIVLARPTLVPLALAGFLARGGIVAVLAPIVVLPTPAGLANVFAPYVVQLYFGHISAGVVILVAAVVAALVTWLLAGGAAGAATDVALIRSAAEDDEVRSPDEPTVTLNPGPADGSAFSSTLVWRAFLVRLVAHTPLLVVLAWSSVRIYQATYAELTSPFEVVTPLVVRILGDVPDAVAAVVIAWLLGEVAGGLGVRYLALGGRSTVAGVLVGWWHMLRHPVATLATLLVTDLVVFVAVATGFAIANIGWELVEATVLGGGNSLLAIGAVVALVAAWLAGLIVIGLVTCWRNIAWTSEWLRTRQASQARTGTGSVERVGTIGGSDDVRPGDWSSADESGTV